MIQAVKENPVTSAVGALQVIAAVILGVLLAFGGTIPEPATVPGWAATVIGFLSGLGNLAGEDGGK